MTTQAFEGFIADTQLREDRLVVRVVAGGFDPEPPFKPVLLVTIEGPANPVAAAEALAQLKDEVDGVYVWSASPTSVGFQSDHGQEVLVSGRGVTIEEQGHTSSDFERLAKLNYQRSEEQYAAYLYQTARLTAVTDLLRQQMQRTAAKAQGHADGTTARILYEQHLSFLERALAAAEA